MGAEFAGSLRERIVIEAQALERSAMGVRQTGWREVARCLAAVEADGLGAEREGMSLSAMPRFSVTIRRREGVAIDQRLRWRGRLLMVRALVEDPARPDRMVLRCEQGRGE